MNPQRERIVSPVSVDKFVRVQGVNGFVIFQPGEFLAPK
jgi:hypothetical protein